MAYPGDLWNLRTQQGQIQVTLHARPLLQPFSLDGFGRIFSTVNVFWSWQVAIIWGVNTVNSPLRFRPWFMDIWRPGQWSPVSGLIKYHNFWGEKSYYQECFKDQLIQKRFFFNWALINMLDLNNLMLKRCLWRALDHKLVMIAKWNCGTNFLSLSSTTDLSHNHLGTTL